MELLWILYFAVQILAVPTVIGAVLAFFLTRQQNDEGRIWRVVGYIVYTLLFAAVSYYLFSPVLGNVATLAFCLYCSVWR